MPPVRILACVLLAFAVVVSPAAAAKRSAATPIIPRGKVAAQTGFEAELRTKVNAARIARRLRPLRGSRILSRAARQHSLHMARTRRLSHVGRGNTLFWRRLVSLGYRKGARMSEIIGQRNVCRRGDPAIMVRRWLASPPHRALMLDRKIRFFGTGVVSTRRCASTFYTVDFAG